MEHKYRHKEGIKIKLSKKSLTILILIVLFSSTLLYYYYFYVSNQSEPVTSVAYYDNILNFRADVRKAEKVPVYPHELAVRNGIMNNVVENVTIAFKPASETENPLYIVEEYEIIMKLIQGYKRIKTNPQFNAVQVSSYDNIAGTIQNPMIVLVHPKYSNETSVSVGFHSIYIKGKTAADLDLATIKFLLVALDINNI